MAESEFLSRDEVRVLTGKARRLNQMEVLKERGLPFQAFGQTLLVSRHHVREWLAGRTVTPSRGPRLDLVT